jgi:hypothetical protein
MREEQTLAEIEDFIEGGSTASGSLPGHLSTGGLGTAGPMLSGSIEPLLRCCKFPRSRLAVAVVVGASLSGKRR